MRSEEPVFGRMASRLAVGGGSILLFYLFFFARYVGQAPKLEKSWVFLLACIST